MSLTTDQVFGNSSTAEDVFAVDNAVADTPWQRALSSLRGGVEQLGETAGKIAQPFAAAADMLAGAPANLVGRIKGAGAQINEVFQGGTKAEQEAAGAAGKELWGPVGEAFKTPFQSAVKSLTGAKHYDQAIVEQALEAVSHKAAEYSGGMLTPYDVNELLGATMDALGVKGISASVKYARARQIESAAKKEMQRQAAKEGTPHEEIFAEPEPISTAPNNKLQKQFTKEIAEGVKELEPPDLKLLFEAAKDPVASVDALFLRARQNRAQDSIPNEAPAIDQAVAKIVADPEARLTQAEATLMREALAKSQGGFMDPRLSLAIIGVAGLTTAGWEYVKRKHPEVAEEIYGRIREKLGIPGPRPKTDEDWRNINENLVPLRNEEGNGLAMEDTLGPLAVGMAMKGKGGMWHPEAVARLVKPLKDRVAAEGRLLEAYPVVRARHDAANDWANKAVTRYLQRYAGTADDPLRDVEVPYQNDTIKWGELSDLAFQQGKFGDIPAASLSPGDVKAFQEGKLTVDTPVFNLVADIGEGPKSRFGEAMKSYLSHVGDFLRQNVDPAKLSQYDLVRAVKETAANDARVAKEMERAAAASTKDLPVYRDYGDGMKWVELKLPEKLTEEQARSVVKVDSVRGKSEPDYVALDGQGKPIRNSYTQEEARGRTPEEAFLAGKLAEEGNQLGHCVGGYCDAVASGESKIYSLRDAKGKSHVTVEVEPPSDWSNVEPNRRVPAANENKPPSILQIKGKQNRAPAEAYRKYVQDFVRNGPDGQPAKWGEVGDLENSGLVTSAKARYLVEGALYDQLPRNERGAFPLGTLAAHDAVKAHVETLANKQKYWTSSDIDKLQRDSVQAHQDTISPLNKNVQRGSVDPKLLAGIAAAGGALAYLTQHPEDSELLAAAGLLAGPRGKVFEAIKSGAQGVDKALGRGTTRLMNIDPTLTRGLNDMELAASKSAARASDLITNFTSALKELAPESRAALEKAYKYNDVAEITRAIRGHPAAVAAYRELRNWITATGETLKGFERFGKGITEYLPRVVKDYKELLGVLGKEEKTALENVMSKANIESIRKKGRELTDVERSLIVNRFIMSEPATSTMPGFARARRVEMTDKTEPYYYGLEDSLIRYAHAATEDIATTRFFGKDLRTTKEGKSKFTNVDDSIGALTDRAMREGRMTPQQAVEAQEILRARFGPGTRAPAGVLQDARNLTGIATLGQIGSGLIQTSEFLWSGYHHEIRPAIEAAGILLTGKGIKPGEFGLANHVIEEVIGKRASGQALSVVLKANLLAAFDQLGMKQNLTASYVKNKQLVSTTKGVKKLAEKWGAFYGEDFPQLVKELKESSMTKRSDLVDSLLYGELTNIRPTNRSTMPQLYNEHPNGRMLWQLKQFMLVQGDILRRDAYNNIKTGEPKKIAEGLANLTRYAAFAAVVTVPADAIKSWILGREFDFAKIDYVENIARNFGLSRYGMDKVMQSGDKPAQKAAEVGIDWVKPPIVSVGEGLAKGLDDPKKLVPLVPLVGRAIYDRELGGNEARVRAETVRARIKARNEREADNPSLKQRRLERKIRRELRGLQ